VAVVTTATETTATEKTYEERDCWRCWRSHGEVYLETSGWTPCPECKGSGRALVFVYAGKRGLS